MPRIETAYVSAIMASDSHPSSGRKGAGRHLLVGVSGASGMPYARTLLWALLAETNYTLHLMFSPAAGEVLKRECGVALKGGRVDPEEFLGAPRPGWGDLEQRLVQYSARDIGARPASGSFVTDGMIICPASMKTVGALSVGMTDHLLTRAADVVLKEGRKLVVVPRETPLSLIHLRALTTLAEAGAIILPAMPGFYHQPETLDDIVEFLVMKILDQFGIDFGDRHRWKPEEARK